MVLEASLPADFAAVFERVARRYKDCGRFAHHYVSAKLRHDPVYREIITLAAKEALGDVADIGCGRGQLGMVLLETGAAHSVVGLDCQGGHLQQAQSAATGLAFTAMLQDLAQCQDIPESTTVLLIDVLYQLEPGVQMALLQAALRAARERIIIRTLDPDRGLRSKLTLSVEKLTRRVSPHAGQHIAACPISCIVRMLNQARFTASVMPCWKGTPFSNVLIIGHPIA